MGKVLKTEKTEYDVIDTPTEVDIGKPYAGGMRVETRYTSFISYQDSTTKNEKIAKLTI